MKFPTNILVHTFQIQLYKHFLYYEGKQLSESAEFLKRQLFGFPCNSGADDCKKSEQPDHLGTFPVQNFEDQAYSKDFCAYPGFFTNRMASLPWASTSL